MLRLHTPVLGFEIDPAWPAARRIVQLLLAIDVAVGNDFAGPQTIEFRLHADAGGTPGALLATAPVIAFGGEDGHVDPKEAVRDLARLLDPLVPDHGTRERVCATRDRRRPSLGSRLRARLAAACECPRHSPADEFFALQFFAAGEPCAAIEYEGCFGGWWHDAPGLPGDPAFYNVGGYQWKAIAGDPEHVFVTARFSMGSYTEERCGIFCGGEKSLYTVRPIPEPGSAILIFLGLVGSSVSGRRRAASRGPARESRSFDGRRGSAQRASGVGVADRRRHPGRSLNERLSR